MKEFSWDQTFLALFDRCVRHYQQGDADPLRWYSATDHRFLRSIGCKPREFADFVEDFAGGGEPTPGTALLVAAVRRDYFRHIQQGVASTVEREADTLPARDATLAGIPWLPRILQKARNKLRGENSPDIMFCCGGDRRFLKDFDIHPADFLRLVWEAGEEDQPILNYLQQRTR